MNKPLAQLSEPTIDPNCPTKEHGFEIDECVCLASWLKARADAVDEEWANYEGGPWDE